MVLAVLLNSHRRCDNAGKRNSPTQNRGPEPLPVFDQAGHRSSFISGQSQGNRIATVAAAGKMLYNHGPLRRWKQPLRERCEHVSIGVIPRSPRNSQAFAHEFGKFRHLKSASSF
jgi:hypothetical protein